MCNRGVIIAGYCRDGNVEREMESVTGNDRRARHAGGSISKGVKQGGCGGQGVTCVEGI